MDLAVKLSVSAAVCVICFIINAIAKHGEKSNGEKKASRAPFWIMIISAWYFIATLIASVYHTEMETEFPLTADRMAVFGVSLSQATVIMYAVIAILTLLALVFRIFVFPRFKAVPHGVQNVMETAVDAVDGFTKSNAGDLGENLGAYMFSIAFLLVGCASVELLGLRPPTADLATTFSLGLMTLVLINIYGIRQKKLSGRVKSLASPSPIIFPMRILSDVAVPVSLACRLFGNMLGGMIVMDLLKSSLGAYSLGVSSLAGLYFNVFHPVIQAYIFITLSLTFINEAAE